MKATKYKLTINAEGLSIDVFRGLVLNILEEIEHECPSGRKQFDDGDNITWNIAAEDVKF